MEILKLFSLAIYRYVLGVQLFQGAMEIPVLTFMIRQVYLSLEHLKGKFSSGIEGALASTLNHDFNWKQLLVVEIILCIFLLMFS